MLDIDKNLRDFQLYNKLIQLKCSEPNQLLMDILLNLTKNKLSYSNPFDHIQITKEEVKGLNIFEITDNIELLARWCDLLQYFKISVVKNCSFAYDYYMQLYTLTQKWQYAFRAFSIVKLKKGVFNDTLDKVEKDCNSVLLALNNPSPYKIMVSLIISIYNNKKDISHYVRDIEKKLHNCIVNKKYNDALYFIESLKLIGKINTEECKKQKSLILEQDADYIIANKEEKTFYPPIIDSYHKALDEIADLKDCKKEKQRLQKKLLAAQEELAKAIQIVGKCTSQKLNLKELYKQIVFDCKIDNPLSAYKAMISFPIISDSWNIFQRKESKQNSPLLYKSFSQHVKINVKGATIRIKKGDEANDEFIRRTAESVLIIYLEELIQIMHNSDNCNISEKFIHEHLIKLNNRFIPEDRILLFVQGIYLGFKGNFSLAAHILLPQMENSFRYIAQQHGIITTKLAEDIQHENTMGGIFEKLKPYTKIDIWKELNYFLVDGVGFRNEAMHGLLSRELLYHYGLYLWWLCLKIIYNTDRYFKFE